MMRSTPVVVLENVLQNVAGDVAALQALSQKMLQRRRFSF
jgi:hypothetical protein